MKYAIFLLKLILFLSYLAVSGFIMFFSKYAFVGMIMLLLLPIIGIYHTCKAEKRLSVKNFLKVNYNHISLILVLIFWYISTAWGHIKGIRLLLVFLIGVVAIAYVWNAISRDEEKRAAKNVDESQNMSENSEDA